MYSRTQTKPIRWRLSLVKANEPYLIEDRQKIEESGSYHYHSAKAWLTHSQQFSPAIVVSEPYNVPFYMIGLDEVNNIVAMMNTSIRYTADPIEPPGMEWAFNPRILLMTENAPIKTFNQMSGETKGFIAKKKLDGSVKWLQLVAPELFPGAHFEIDLLPAEEDNEGLIALRVFGSFPIKEFKKRRHLLCKEMLNAGHKDLYMLISIFQRRVTKGGWETFSFYSAILAE